MKIDLNKCYEAMKCDEPSALSMIGPFVRQQINLYVQEYDRQLREQLAERHISHLSLAHGLTNEAAEAQAEQPYTTPTETCECVGRQRLMGLDMLYYDTRALLWYRATKKDGRVETVVCPLCDKPLP